MQLCMMFSRLTAANIKLKLSKCELGMSSVTYLGHLVTRAGIAQDPLKTAAIDNWPMPWSLSHLRSFLGLASYYRRFVKNFSRLAAPLNALLHKDTSYIWNTSCQVAFATLKHHLVTSPVLIFPDFTQPFLLQTDWRQTGVGAILSQYDTEHRERVVAYASRACTSAERAYAPVHGECLALVWAIQHFRPYLYGRRFSVEQIIMPSSG